MAEPTLSLGYADISAHVGRFLGWGGTSANWTADQLARINGIVDSGLRQFYYAAIPPDRNEPHQWSFLFPTGSIVTSAADYTYDMPDDYGLIEGDFTFAAADSARSTVKVVGEGQIRHLQSLYTSQSGKPTYAAIRPAANDGTTGIRWEVIFYPTPDAAYTLTYKYVVNRNYIRAAAPYPLGGAMHAETILESCLSVAEQREDDAEGVHTKQYRTLLAASIMMDRRHGPHFLGYNGDRSDGRTGGFERENYVTYNGSLP